MATARTSLLRTACTKTEKGTCNTCSASEHVCCFQHAYTKVCVPSQRASLCHRAFLTPAARHSSGYSCEQTDPRHQTRFLQRIKAHLDRDIGRLPCERAPAAKGKQVAEQQKQGDIAHHPVHLLAEDGGAP